MAVLEKARSKKAVVLGPVAVGYGNYAVIGLLENKHITLTVMAHPDNEKARTHYLKMGIEEAASVAKSILSHIKEFS